MINSVSGRLFVKNRAFLKLKIGNLEKIVTLLVIDNDKFSGDLLIGLDVIERFRLRQTERLKIEQNVNNKSKEVPTTTRTELNFLTNTLNKEEFESRKFDNLKQEQEDLVKNLLKGKFDLFASDKYDVDQTVMGRAEIKLKNNRIIAQRPYNCTVQDGKEIEDQIERLLERNLIEESTSPYAAPVTLADKKEEKRSRLCIDFSRLNKILEDESQPFIRIEDIIHKLVDCVYFSKLDLNSAFWSVSLAKEDRYKTAFVTKFGHYQWKVLPFGLKTSPAIFQRLLSATLRKYKCSEYAVNYMDDILIFSKSFNEHIDHLKNVLFALERERFKLKFSKCEFAKEKITYLGHLIEKNKIKPVNDDLISVQKAIPPKNIEQLRRYLGKINFYHKYIPNASKLLDPLHNLLRKGVTYVWSSECESSFRRLNTYLCTGPVLRIFDPKKQSYIFTDASGFGIAATLKQIAEDNELHPVAYFSMKLPVIKTRRDAIYIELLAIKKAIDYWHYYLYGKEFIVVTDHAPLEGLHLKTKPETKLGQMAMFLDQYKFKIIYRRGKLNVEADELSRLPVLDYYDGEENDWHANLMRVEEMSDLQRNLVIKEKDKKNVERRDGIWLMKKKNKKKIMVDEKSANGLVQKMHLKFGHIGKSKLVNLLNRRFYISNLIKRVCDCVNKCEICIKNKTRRIRKLGYCTAIGPPNEPYDIMSLDTVGGMGKYIHILIDHSTKYVWARSSPTQSASNFVKLISPIVNITNINKLLVDQYSAINSVKFKDFAKSNNIKLLFTPVDNPQSNGVVERVGQTITNKMRCKLNDKRNQRLTFEKMLEVTIEEYNNTIHESTGFTPKYLLLGIDTNQTVFDKIRNLSEDRERAKRNLTSAIMKNKKRIDVNRRDQKFIVGDKVYVEMKSKLNRSKSDHIREGPYEIVEIISPLLFRLNTNKKRKESNVFHKNKLIPCIK